MRGGQMRRREFISLLAGSATAVGVARAASRAGSLGLDLRVPLSLATCCIINRMDPEAGFRPWFALDVRDGVPTRLRHDSWDHGDMSGRFLEGLILARHMVPASADMLQAEARIRAYLVSVLGSAGVIVNPDTGRRDHPFSQGSALYGLVTDFNDSGAPEARQRIEALIRGLDASASHRRDYLVFDELATPLAPCSQHAAYQVLPVMRFHELTGDPQALDYARRLSRWAFYHDPTVTVDGVITQKGWEGHLHAWMDTYTGILRCARAGGDPPLKEVVERSRKMFAWVLEHETTPYGWVADSVGSGTCETCTISSAIRLALELIREGDAGYWNDIERFVRNQLVQNQFRNVDGLGIRDQRVARGLLGAFDSYADPNTLIANRNGTIEGCCINGGIRGLYLAYQNAIHESAQSIHVNLLLSHGTPGIEVASHLPDEGRLELHLNCSKDVVLRCPDWVRLADVAIDAPAGIRGAALPDTHSLRIVGGRPGIRITIRFAQRRLVQESVVAGRRYQVSWHGDTVTGITPAGEPYRLYRTGAGPGPGTGGPYRQPRIAS